MTNLPKHIEQYLEKEYAPVCPFDLMPCEQHSELTLSGCTNCHNCDRGNNGVRATGGMPALEKVVNAVKKLFK